MPEDKLVVLLGNPNVGKSTVFNRITGKHQHTGNWSGKTVDCVCETYLKNKEIKIVDLPGIYSLSSANAEERCSRDFIINHKNALVIIIADGNCICKSLNLIEEASAVTRNIIVCINQYKSAKKSGIYIDLDKMKSLLKVPVITSEASEKNGIEEIEKAIEINTSIINNIPTTHKININRDEFFNTVVKEKENNIQRKLDKIFTSKVTGIPIMIVMLAIILYITIIGANYPSELLSNIFAMGGKYLDSFLKSVNIPLWLCSLITDGMYRTVTWVIAVMLPPMALFFPIFALLENFGYLPRVAFNLDNIFKKANCSGKQALCMCSAFGCNACGVTGCRIIENKNQRLNAIVTNNFVPCNGRFPTLIAIITIFMTSMFSSTVKSIYSALILTGFIVISIMISMVWSYVLSKTLLKNNDSELVMEMPKFKKPKILKTIYDSVKNRAVFVLLRALEVALPAGVLIWICANINIGENTILSHIVTFLDPVGKAFGLDGEILIGFILGFPANEIVIPIVLMAYSGSSVMVDYSSIEELGRLLITNGWTIKTAVCMITLVLMHYPCSTTCLTIYKETKSVLWTLFSIIMPTITGLLLCFIINLIL
jgi:ferrous iron transport protein B